MSDKIPLVKLLRLCESHGYEPNNDNILFMYFLHDKTFKAKIVNHYLDESITKRSAANET